VFNINFNLPKNVPWSVARLVAASELADVSQKSWKNRNWQNKKLFFLSFSAQCKVTTA
jgi:hypothetical protein